MVRAILTNSPSWERRALRSTLPAALCPSGRGGEHRAELFFEQVGAVEHGVGRLDPGQTATLLGGEMLRVPDHRPAGVAVLATGVFQGAAADLVQCLRAPHHHMKGLIPTSG